MAVPGKASCAQLLRRLAAPRRVRTPTGPLGTRLQDKHEGEFSSFLADQSSGISGEVAGPSAVRRAVTSLSALLLSDIQMKLMKRATAALADALAGPGAPASLRLLLRRSLRAFVLLAHTASYAVRMWALAVSVAHLGDSAMSLSSEAELASALTTLLCPAIVPATPTPSSPSVLLLRAVASTSTLAMESIDICTAAEGLGHLDNQHSNLLTGAAQALDLLTVCPSLVESCQELAEVAAEAAKHSRMRQPTVGGGDTDRDSSGGDCL